jgi:hypothetical protein
MCTHRYRRDYPNHYKPTVNSYHSHLAHQVTIPLFLEVCNEGISFHPQSIDIHLVCTLTMHGVRGCTHGVMASGRLFYLQYKIMGRDSSREVSHAKL